MAVANKIPSNARYQPNSPTKNLIFVADSVMQKITDPIATSSNSVRQKTIIICVLRFQVPPLLLENDYCQP